MSEKIVSFGAYRDREQPEGAVGTDPHLAGEAKCLACAHEWAFVAPMPLTTLLTCPKCDCARGVMKYAVSRDDAHWHCHCGNHLFEITQRGTYCPNCGDWQAFP